MRRLRFVAFAFAFFGLAPQSQAADLGGMILRGSNGPGSSCCITWNGVYGGGHIGANWSGTDFAGSTGELVAFMLRNTTIEDEHGVSRWNTLGKSDTSGKSYGAFVGYNTQWDDAVVGVEAGYSRTNMYMSASDGMRRIFGTSDGYTNDVQVTGTSSIRVTDYGTLRARGGWAAGNFMPYGFVGLAIGRMDVTRSATVDAAGSSPSGPPYSFTQTSSDIRNGYFAYGYTAGLGVDFALMQNIFVRAEYEYVYFGNVVDLKTSLHTARIGAGVKF